MIANDQGHKGTEINQNIGFKRRSRMEENNELAETEGFEPSVPNSQHGGLANRWFQPLTHVSTLARATKARRLSRIGAIARHEALINWALPAYRPAMDYFRLRQRRHAVFPRFKPDFSPSGAKSTRVTARSLLFHVGTR
jgi:hypothetical protein